MIWIIAAILAYCAWAYWYLRRYPVRKVTLGVYAGQALATPFALLWRIFTRVDATVCITVDGDLENDDVSADAGILLTREILEKRFDSKNITWFVNIADWDWLSTHKKRLNELTQHGYDVQLHSHFIEQETRKNTTPSDKQVTKSLKKQRTQLEKAIKRDVTAFRAGMMVLGGKAQAIKKAGFSIDSSISPGMVFDTGDGVMVDHDTAFKARPYELDGLTEVPIHLNWPPYLFVQARKNHITQPVFTILFHPNELYFQHKKNSFRIFTLRIQFFLLGVFFPDAQYKAVSQL